ncbi:MAG: DUF4115 domain-containing protein [Acidimicrobiales bacterium]
MVVVGVTAGMLARRRTHDDVHSVEHYHRQLHTLEEMRTHLPTGSSGGHQNGNEAAAFPASPFRVSGSSTVRLTESGRPPVPPAPPPPVPNPAEPVTFDDAGPEPVRPTFMSGTEDRVMESMNHRPRRLAGPAAAVAAVVVLIVVLVVTGLHSNSSPHHGGAATATTSHTRPPPTRHQTTTTTSTAPPTVSEPQGGTAHTATYQVSAPSFALSVAATAGECWVEATDTANGSVLFTATLFPGQSHTIAASGPVTVIAGAPGSFAATVNGSAVTLPLGYQAPFTLTFQTTPSTA